MHFPAGLFFLIYFHLYYYDHQWVMSGPSTSSFNMSCSSTISLNPRAESAEASSFLFLLYFNVQCQFLVCPTSKFTSSTPEDLVDIQVG